MATVSSFNPPGRASRRDFDAMAFFADSSRSTCIPGRLERLMMASWLPSWELELRDTGDEALLLWLSHPSRRRHVRQLVIRSWRQPLAADVQLALAALKPAHVLVCAATSEHLDFTALARLVPISTIVLLFDNPPPNLAGTACNALSNSCNGPVLNCVQELRIAGYTPRFGPLQMPPLGTFAGVRMLTLNGFTVADPTIAAAIFSHFAQLVELDWSLQRPALGRPLDLQLDRMCAFVPPSLTELSLSGLDTLLDVIPSLSHLHALQHLALQCRFDTVWWLAQAVQALEGMLCWGELESLTLGSAMEPISSILAHAGLIGRNAMHADEGASELDRSGASCVVSRHFPSLQGLCLALPMYSTQPWSFPSTRAAADAADVAFCVLQA